MHELHHIPMPAVLDMTQAEVTQDNIRRQASPAPKFKRITGLLAALFAVGIVSVVLRVMNGFDDRNEWGYHASIVGYMLITAQSAVLVSIALRMVKAHWRRSLARVSELFAIVGLLNFIIYIPLLWVLPSTEGRLSLWFDFPGNSPHIWNTVSLATLVITGLALLWFAAIPDIATMRDSEEGSKHGRYRRFAMGWHGTQRQWVLLNAGISVLGGFYFLMLIFTHCMISVDFSMALIPGWKDAIYPTFHALSGFQSGIATVIVTLFILRRFGGLESYIEVDQFWALSKMLLATCLLWFYFWWSSFFTYWYGRTPAEQGVLDFLMVQTYRPLFMLTWALCFPVPFLILIWNAIRKTDWGPTLAASIILVGQLCNMMRLYVPAFSIEDVTLHALEVAPEANMPGIMDIATVVGLLAGAVLVYMMATRLFPILSIWEIKEGMMLQRKRKFLKTELRSLGKPE